jgi:alkylation response protein AidB-like acyl-CoA dehydrogenase
LNSLPPDDELRAEIRAWLAENGMNELRDLRLEDVSGYNADVSLREWRERLHDGGWLGLSWPREYGGRGLSPVQIAIVDDEFARARLPRMTRGIAEFVAGPMILGSGSEEQKARFIPRIVRGEDRYAQGFSEPGAGSDLASLTTRGEVDGDVVRIYGQKVWTSFFAAATHVMALVRTDPAASKHAGISAVIVPLEIDGQPNSVHFRGLRELTGETIFAETLFDGAVAPIENVIGGLGGGWAAAQHALASERSGLMTLQISNLYGDLRDLVRGAVESRAIEDARVKDDLAWAYTRLRAIESENHRLLAQLAAGDPVSPWEPSRKRILVTEFERDFTEMALRLQGDAALKVGPEYGLSHWQKAYLGARSRTIFGGTSEIHRNIIAERILGLPKEPVRAGEKGTK